MGGLFLLPFSFCLLSFLFGAFLFILVWFRFLAVSVLVLVEFLMLVFWFGITVQKNTDCPKHLLLKRIHPSLSEKHRSCWVK